MPAARTRTTAALAATAAFALATACTAPIHTTTDDGTLRVWSDGGGSLEDRRKQIDQLAREGTRVEILGPCASACTMYLGLTNTHAQKDVVFGCHGSTSLTGLPLPADEKASYDATMALMLPGPIRDIYWREWRHMTYATHQVPATRLKEIAPGHIKLIN